MAPPSRLYLTAFDNRFSKTCFRRVRSACTRALGAIGNSTRTPRAAASGAIMPSHSASTSASSTGSIDRLTAPASTFARSRISLISVSRCRPDFRMWPENSSFCSGVVGMSFDARIWAKPRMAFSGVRSSWLIDDRNADFAWLAFLASSIASPSSELASSSWAVRSCTRASRRSFRRAISRFESSSARVRCSISVSIALKESTSSAASSSLMRGARRE